MFRWITTTRYTQYVFILTFYIKVHNLSIFLQKPKDNYSMYIIMKTSTKGGAVKFANAKKGVQWCIDNGMDIV